MWFYTSFSGFVQAWVTIVLNLRLNPRHVLTGKNKIPYYLFKTARADLHDGIFTDEQAVIKQVMLCQFVMSSIRSVSVIDLLSMQIKMLTRGLQMYSVTF